MPNMFTNGGLLLVFSFVIHLSNTKCYNNQYKTNAKASYYILDKFWTNSGLCPASKQTHMDVKTALLSDAMLLNLRIIGSLPKGAITHLRIHWLLELVKFVAFNPHGIPIYDFTESDLFLSKLVEYNLSPVIEFMGNLSNLFVKNPNYNEIIWTNFSYEFIKHYLSIYGKEILSKWRFETWNEPDVLNYNKLNFTLKTYLSYIDGLKQGLEKISVSNGIKFKLAGPAGLFKNPDRHPLCWGLLQFCNNHSTNCPVNILSYHRKGNGTDITELINSSKKLWRKIYSNLHGLIKFPISNDEADPISNWSIGRPFQTDMRYAVTLVNIICEHWNAKLVGKELKNLETISHDNAFLSYHPKEFSQRTLLAHFRINNTTPQHSQFIQKPVYGALGLLSHLGEFAKKCKVISPPLKQCKIKLWKTRAGSGKPTYLCWLLMSTTSTSNLLSKCRYKAKLRSALNDLERYACIVEGMDQLKTNPYKIWLDNNRPAFPNTTLRILMRQHQRPQLLSSYVMMNTTLMLDISQMKPPWLVLVRICSHLTREMYSPVGLTVTRIATNDVLITWKESNAESLQCLKTYQVWYRYNNYSEWLCISMKQHLPFPLMQYAPIADEQTVNGTYAVRGIDVFNRVGPFSEEYEYVDI